VKRAALPVPPPALPHVEPTPVSRRAVHAVRPGPARIGRVLVAHNPVSPGDDPSTSDVLAQVALVEDALALLGIPAERVEVAGGRPWESAAIAGAKPPAPTAGGANASGSPRARRDPRTVVFNLVEAPPGAPHLHTGNAEALERMGLPFTGSPSSVLWLTTDKLATRDALATAGLPVAPGGRLDPARPDVLARVPPPWIVKPAWEDASIGLEGNPVCDTEAAALARCAMLTKRFTSQPVLLERFLPGRELNVSLLADGAGGVQTLPVAEIAFVDFPPDLPPVVGYEAKWQEGSFAYAHTPRRFPEESADGPLLARVRDLALAAWRICGLAGYGRVDLRLDERGDPHILEVNANPCLAPDAGFLAAAERAGLKAREVVGLIVAAALTEFGKD
jgi:D-alanine-D-alanine ligase